MGKKALITGITGQDGSYLAEFLLDKGYEVHGIIRRSSSFNTGRIDHIYQDPHISDAKIFLHFGDMTEGGGIANLITELNPDEIYNLAAQSQVRVSFDIPEYTENVVGLGAVRILEAIRHINTKIKYYQASSCFVKGTKILTRKFIERQRYGKKQRFLTLGTKSIEDLIVGDEVLSYNEKTAKKEYKLVERISHRMSDNVFKIKFSNGNFLVASDNHPFFVIGKGWVQLKNLIVGDEVIQKQYNGLYGGIIRQGKSFEDFFGLDKSIVMRNKASVSHTGRPNSMKDKTYPEGHRIRGIGQHPERAAKHPWNLNLRKETSSKLFEIGQHISISQKKSWQNRTEESKATFIRKVFLGNQKKFNGLEKKISYLLRTVCPGEFKFNGDGRIAILNGKMPDFVNVNGKKKVIEVFCSYWKEKNYDTVDQYMDIRRKEINDQGYDVLFINQKEFRDKKKLKDKIKTFIYNPAIDIIKVASIEFEDKDRMVYNIEVKDNHNFFAKGILVHNSEIFGDSPPPQNELTYMRPNSPYSVAKLGAYWNTVNYRTGYGLFACNGILFNHESPRRGETFVTRKITMAAARIKAGLQKDLFLGNMEAKRDWGYSKEYCFPSGTKILTIAGDSYHKIHSTSIESVKVGDKVLSWNGKTKEVDTVERIFCRESEEFVTVYLSNGNCLRLTCHHPIAVNKCGEIVWTEAKDMQKDDEVIQYNHYSTNLRIMNLKSKNKTNVDRFGEMKAQNISAKHSQKVKGKNFLDRCKDIDKEISWKSKISDNSKARWKNKEYREMMLSKLLGNQYALGNVYNSPKKGLGYDEYYGVQRSQEIKKKLSDNWNSWERCLLMRGKTLEEIYGVEKSEDIKKKLSISSQKMWDSMSKLDKEARISDLVRKSGRYFNLSEAKLFDVINEVCPNYFVYNGDGKFQVENNITFNGMLPDFVSRMGNKKVIEFFGDYWHDGGIKEERERQKKFKELGYECLVIWSEDIKNKNLDRLKERIKNFLYNPNVEIVKVVSIEKDTKIEKVFNIETKNNNNYFAYGVLVHNCEAMFQMMQLDKAEDIVIGTGETHTVREFVEEAFSCLDLDYRDYIKIDPRYYRPNEVNFLQADISKAKRLLNWEPKAKFKELVRLMMDADVELFKN